MLHFFRAVCFLDCRSPSFNFGRGRPFGIIMSKECQQNIVCCHNELSISRINSKSSGGSRVYPVSELVEFSKHWSRLGSFITSWLDSRAYPMYNVFFEYADTWKSPVLMSLSDV